jgi:hypothetical protein
LSGTDKPKNKMTRLEGST